MPPALYFFLRIALAVWSLLCFYVSFMIIFLHLFKKMPLEYWYRLLSVCVWLSLIWTLILKSHGQKSLVGCSPWSHKESGMTEQLILTNINPSSPLTWDIFPFIFVFLSFFLINIFLSCRDLSLTEIYVYVFFWWDHFLCYSDNSLLYRNASDFCMSVLYPAALQNSLIRSHMPRGWAPQILGLSVRLEHSGNPQETTYSVGKVDIPPALLSPLENHRLRAESGALLTWGRDTWSACSCPSCPSNVVCQGLCDDEGASALPLFPRFFSAASHPWRAFSCSREGNEAGKDLCHHLVTWLSPKHSFMAKMLGLPCSLSREPLLQGSKPVWEPMIFLFLVRDIFPWTSLFVGDWSCPCAHYCNLVLCR